MSNTPAPVLSKKQQNKTVNNKKKSLKSIRNLVTTTEASFWPKLSDESEREEIFGVLKAYSESIQAKAKINNPETTEKQNEVAKFKGENVKFGINEISRRITLNDCDAILIDESIPKILALQITSTSAFKQIPLLCIENLSAILKNLFGFRSSSICFTKNREENGVRVCNEIRKKCIKHFDSVYTNKNVTGSVCNAISDDKKIIDDSNATDAAEESLKFLEIREFLDKSKKATKRKLTYQPLLIKRVKSNPKRKENK